MTTQSFDMYTAAGDRACASLVNRISKKIRSRMRFTASEILKMIEEGKDKISKKYEEVDDTEPRGIIYHRVSIELRNAGYGFYFDSFGGDYSGLYPYGK